MAQDTKELRKRLLEPPQYTILGDEAIRLDVEVRLKPIQGRGRSRVDFGGGSDGDS